MSTFQAIGNVEIHLPYYMKKIQSCKEEGEFHPYGPIVACGINPGTKKLVMLDSNDQLYELNVIKFFQTDRVVHEAFPTRGGTIVEFMRDDMVVTVDSDDLIESSTKIQLTNLTIGMMHEDQVINLA